MQKKILIIGCGRIGLALSKKLTQGGYDVTATRRSIDQLPKELKSFAMDVTRPETFAAFEATAWDAIIVTLTARGEEAYRAVYVEGLKQVLTSLTARALKPLVLFASSTSVYHQNDGSTVNEFSDTFPQGYSGKTMLAAEQLLKGADLPAAAIRFSGIYGDFYQHNDDKTVEQNKPEVGGHLLQVLKSGRICPQSPLRISNRIHVIDCVEILNFLLENYFRGESIAPIYLGCDNQAATLREIMEHIAAVNQIDIRNLTEDYLPNRGGNKRCEANLLKAQGYRVRVSSYREGYA